MGEIALLGTHNGLCRVEFDPVRAQLSAACPALYMKSAAEQIQKYLQGRQTGLDIPLDLRGTPFQLKVWHVLREIAYGHTVSYKEVALRVGNPRACRAVGGANNKNPVPIIVPCHRVVGHDGRLVGYGSGLWRKKMLLQLEGIAVKGSKISPVPGQR